MMSTCWEMHPRTLCTHCPLHGTKEHPAHSPPMPVSPPITPDAVPASEPISSILRRAASLSGCLIDAHHASTALFVRAQQLALVLQSWLDAAAAGCPTAEGIVWGCSFIGCSTDAWSPAGTSRATRSSSPALPSQQASSELLMMHMHCASDGRSLLLSVVLLLLQLLCTGVLHVAALDTEMVGAKSRASEQSGVPFTWGTASAAGTATSMPRAARCLISGLGWV